MFREMGLSAFNAWKCRVEFPIDNQDAAVNAAVEWLHKDRYIKTTVGLEGVVDAATTVIRDMDVDKTLSVPANQTGEVGYLKAMLGHVSFSSVKVSLEEFALLCLGFICASMYLAIFAFLFDPFVLTFVWLMLVTESCMALDPR